LLVQQLSIDSTIKDEELNCICKESFIGNGKMLGRCFPLKQAIGLQEQTTSESAGAVEHYIHLYFLNRQQTINRISSCGGPPW
jgi:hypothetical protein